MLINVKLIEEKSEIEGGCTWHVEGKPVRGGGCVREGLREKGDGQIRETRSECGWWQREVGTVPSIQW